MSGEHSAPGGCEVHLWAQWFHFHRLKTAVLNCVTASPVQRSGQPSFWNTPPAPGVQPRPRPGGRQLATPWGTSGISEEKNVLKKTQAVHMIDTRWGGTNTAVNCSSPSEPSPPAAAGSSLPPSAASSAWREDYCDKKLVMRVDGGGA